MSIELHQISTNNLFHFFQLNLPIAPSKSNQMELLIDELMKNREQMNVVGRPPAATTTLRDVDSAVGTTLLIYSSDGCTEPTHFVLLLLLLLLLD